MADKCSNNPTTTTTKPTDQMQQTTMNDDLIDTAKDESMTDIPTDTKTTNVKHLDTTTDFPTNVQTLALCWQCNSSDTAFCECAGDCEELIQITACLYHSEECNTSSTCKLNQTTMDTVCTGESNYSQLNIIIVFRIHPECMADKCSNNPTTTTTKPTDQMQQTTVNDDSDSIPTNTTKDSPTMNSTSIIAAVLSVVVLLLLAAIVAILILYWRFKMKVRRERLENRLSQ